MNVNIKCLVKACRESHLDYKFIDQNHNFVQINKNGSYFYFHNHLVPIISRIFGKIAGDKEFTYHLLKTYIRMPKTKGYLDPATIEKFDEYKRFKSLNGIFKDIEKEFEFPLIIKRNSGAVGNNVFMCNSRVEVEEKAKVIFNKNSNHYDYVLLAQEKLNIKKEYRVIILNNKIELVYLKDNSKGQFVGNLSPLHWRGSVASPIKNYKLEIKNLGQLVSKISGVISMDYAGLDVVEDENGELYLLEMNSQPGYDNFIRDNGDSEVVRIYKKILELM